MKTVRYFLFLFFMLHLLCYEVYAQDAGDVDYGKYHHSFQWWTSVQISKEFKYGVSINGQYLLRADITNRSIAGHYFYSGIKYKPLKFLHLDFKFRGVNKPDENLYRFEFGIKPRYKYNNWTFSFRTAYFNEREYFSRVYQKGHAPTNYWRNRIGIEWEFKKDWKAYLTAEIYTLFSNTETAIRRVAFIGGVSRSILNLHKVEVYYMAQPDFNKKKLNLVQAIAMIYTLDIPKNSKLKKKK